MIVIDGTDLLLGRMATFAAKQALLGQEVRVINAEKAVISGTRSAVLAKVRQKLDRGIPLKGPYVPKMPDRYVRRTIRGMLPHKQAKGTEAFKRVLCYVGVPKELEGQATTTLEFADVKKLPNYSYVTVHDALKYA